LGEQGEFPSAIATMSGLQTDDNPVQTSTERKCNMSYELGIVINGSPKDSHDFSAKDTASVDMSRHPADAQRSPNFHGQEAMHASVQAVFDTVRP
jgi:hypothetical protein